MGKFLEACCVMKPIVVEAKLAEAMVALWVVLYDKEASFSEVVFEGDAAQMVAEIHLYPPYFSKNGQMIESIIKKLNGFTVAKFAHVNRECNTVAHALAKEAANRRMSKYWREVALDCISSIILREHMCP
jgi:hypothetical protein